MEYLSKIYGLTGESDPTSENGQLFLVDYAFLLYQRGFLSQEAMIAEIFKSQLENSRASKGLFHRNPNLKTKILSHDNLSAIFAYSRFIKTSHRFEIWKHLLVHFGTYDNTQGKSKQFSRFLPFNPSNFFIWGLCADSILAYLFLPFFLVNLIITCNKRKEETSGKILLDIELYPIMSNPIVKLCFKYYDKKMIEQYGHEYQTEIRKIYHGNNSKEFPINKLLGIGHD